MSAPKSVLEEVLGGLETIKLSQEGLGPATSRLVITALSEAKGLLEEAERAMDQAWATVGDRLLAKGPLSKEYAHAASNQLDDARRRIRAALGRG